MSRYDLGELRMKDWREVMLWSEVFLKRGVGGVFKYQFMLDWPITCLTGSFSAQLLNYVGLGNRLRLIKSEDWLFQSEHI